MPGAITRHELRRLIESEHAQVVEVLPKPEYEWAHIAGAVNIPLKGLDEASAAGLERGRPVVVYCNDLQWDMSPRAAWRLERFGFASVFDYEAGKMDWLSYGLPHGGSAVLAGDVVDRSVATCNLDASLGDARSSAEEHGDGLCVVVTDGDVVMGMVRGEALDGPADRRVEEAMTFGVSTVRPSEDVEALVERMSRAGVEAILVTSSDARLLGVLRRAEAEGATRHGSG